MRFGGRAEVSKGIGRPDSGVEMAVVSHTA